MEAPHAALEHAHPRGLCGAAGEDLRFGFSRRSSSHLEERREAIRRSSSAVSRAASAMFRCCRSCRSCCSSRSCCLLLPRMPLLLLQRHEPRLQLPTAMKDPLLLLTRARLEPRMRCRLLLELPILLSDAAEQDRQLATGPAAATDATANALPTAPGAPPSSRSRRKRGRRPAA